jgi:hypothetical protein
MDALRVRSRLRLAPVLEWFVAASFLFATFAVGSMILNGLRPSAAPARVVPTARTLVASTPAAVAARLGRAAESGKQEVDRGKFGDRLTRFYEYAGSRFILVFEPFELNGEARIAGIYIP